jgi:hypothetical protein
MNHLKPIKERVKNYLIHKQKEKFLTLFFISPLNIEKNLIKLVVTREIKSVLGCSTYVELKKNINYKNKAIIIR